MAGDWRERLARASRFTLARLPSLDPDDPAHWVRVVADRAFLFEVAIAPDLVASRWFSPGTRIQRGQVAAVRGAGALTAAGQFVGTVGRSGDRVAISDQEGRPVATEGASENWASEFVTVDGVLIASRSSPIATVEDHVSVLQVAENCSEQLRLLLIAGGLVAADRDRRRYARTRG